MRHVIRGFANAAYHTHVLNATKTSPFWLPSAIAFRVLIAKICVFTLCAHHYVILTRREYGAKWAKRDFDVWHIFRDARLSYIHRGRRCARLFAQDNTGAVDKAKWAKEIPWTKILILVPERNHQWADAAESNWKIQLKTASGACDATIGRLAPISFPITSNVVWGYFVNAWNAVYCGQFIPIVQFNDLMDFVWNSSCGGRNNFIDLFFFHRCVASALAARLKSCWPIDQSSDDMIRSLGAGLVFPPRWRLHRER